MGLKHTGLLLLVIAVLDSPHEMNCVKIILDGFEPKTPSSRTCTSSFQATGRMILNEGETLGNLPPHIVCQFKCPYFNGSDREIPHLEGTQDGSWFLRFQVPLKSCEPQETTFPNLNCTPSTERNYRIAMSSMQSPYFAMKFCSMRLFLGEVEKVNGRQIVINEHGLKGLSNEFAFLGFTEVPYYNKTLYEWCEEESLFKNNPSLNGASDSGTPADILVLYGGVAMASALFVV